ncbi:MAG: heavy metal translocating P-type ATPase [Oligoflexia bacterium]|nr:heavy metal translocating P-type ATPase [Oligoflexia bacterium]
MDFKIEGMDCAEEIAILKRELSPMVGGEEFLFFDLINGKLSVKNQNKKLNSADVIKSVGKTGMKATPWGVPQQIGTSKRKIKATLTLTSIVSLLAAFFIHWFLHGSFKHAFLAGEETSQHQFPTISIFIYCISILSGGWFIFPKAFYSLKKMRPDMNLLMTIAVIGAAIIGEWLEAATVTVLFSFSLTLEAWSVGRARRATKALLELAPNTARVLTSNGEEKTILATQVEIGMIFIVKPGEKIPLDGTVIKGNSEVNQSPITGESLPIAKSPGLGVYAGTINGDGALEIKCEKIFENSTLSNIIKLVSSAHEKRAPSEQWVEKFAKIYTPVVMVTALLVLFIPPLFMDGIWSQWIYRSLVLLVIACPCALVISTPVSIVAALTTAAKNGVLIKGSKYIELPAHLKAIALDKTGTITKGELAVSRVIPSNHHTEGELLEIAASIESRSEHPIAKAIIQHAKTQGININPANNYQTIKGKGATAQIQNKNYWLGSHRYLEEKGQEDQKTHNDLENLINQGHTIVVIGDEEHVCGFIALSDTIREEAKDIIAKLHKSGIKHIVMLTGDNTGTAKLIANKVGLDHFYAELLPEDKVQRIVELVDKYKVVAMVGDGVNDAPAMARANMGIAMGVAGSDAAIESADIALMNDDISKIPWLIKHSKKTMGVIKQNIGFSLAVKALFMVLTFAGHSSLWGAIAADMGASFAVIFNGLRLLRGLRP